MSPAQEAETFDHLRHMSGMRDRRRADIADITVILGRIEDKVRKTIESMIDINSSFSKR